MNPHVFAGNPLDRGDVYRRDQQWLDEQAGNARSRFLPLWQLNVLIQAAQETRLGWVGPADIARLDIAVPPIFLGLQNDIAHFAIDVSQLGDPRHEFNLDEAWRFEEPGPRQRPSVLLRPVFWPRVGPSSTGTDAISSAACAASAPSKAVAARYASAWPARPTIFLAPILWPLWS